MVWGRGLGEGCGDAVVVELALVSRGALADITCGFGVFWSHVSLCRVNKHSARVRHPAMIPPPAAWQLLAV